jgi:hypothetical protein
VAASIRIIAGKANVRLLYSSLAPSSSPRFPHFLGKETLVINQGKVAARRDELLYFGGGGAGRMKIGYARVSTTEQNLDLQRDALKAAGCGKIIEDTASGGKTQRAGLDRA